MLNHHHWGSSSPTRQPGNDQLNSSAGQACQLGDKGKLLQSSFPLIKTLGKGDGRMAREDAGEEETVVYDDGFRQMSNPTCRESLVEVPFRVHINTLHCGMLRLLSVSFFKPPVEHLTSEVTTYCTLNITSVKPK
jgi:hypothetical protein